MLSLIKLFATALPLAVLAGCASIPMDSPDTDAKSKAFPTPPADQAGLYIYRDSYIGQGLKMKVKIDGKVIGETLNHVYFYRLIAPGQHVIATESEFSDNTLDLIAVSGQNYYIRQSMKIGIFLGGANLKLMQESIAQDHLQKSSLATNQD